jgi:hypothetical protein
MDDLNKWVNTLSKKELRATVYHLTERLMESDDVRFNEIMPYPYWETCGESINPMQDEMEQ